MSDPIDSVGTAAAAYIAATDERGAHAASHFDYTINVLWRALRQGVITDAERQRLVGEWQDIRQAKTGSPAPEDVFRLRQAQRDFADTAAYLALEPGEAEAQALRPAAPVAVPEGAAHLEHAMVDTGRYSLRINKDDTVRIFDKATGEEHVLGRGPGGAMDDPALGLIDASLGDGTLIRFLEAEIVVAKNGQEASVQVDGSGPVLREADLHGPVARFVEDGR